MKPILLTTTALVAIGLSAISARAADMNYPIHNASSPDYTTPVEFGSGWYIRGDIGYNVGGRQGTGAVFIPDIGEYLVYDYDDAMSLRGGFGFQVNPNFRIEATVENLFDSSFENTVGMTFGGTRDYITPDGAGGFTTNTVAFDRNGNNLTTGTGYEAPLTGSQRIEASYDAQTVMAHAYFDLPNVGKFTPYVGAGAGLANISYSETREFNCVAGSNEQCNANELVGTDYTRSAWGYAYSVSAGTAYALTENLSLDLGYTYLSVKSGEELNYDDGTAIEFDGFSVHQVRAGLRYQIW